MKSTALTILLFLISVAAFSQQPVPDFKANIFYTNSIDIILKQGIKDYDLIIAFRTFSNHTLETEYRLLVLNQGKWQRLLFKDKRGSSMQLFDDSFQKISTNNSDCNTLFSSLNANHFFTIEDDKINPCCTERDTLIKGVKRTYSFGIQDGSEVQLWMITHKKSRHLYYYAPEFYVKYCQPCQDRKDLLNIMVMLNKGW